MGDPGSCRSTRVRALAAFCAGDIWNNSDSVRRTPGSMRPTSAAGRANGWRLPASSTIAVDTVDNPVTAGDAAEAPEGTQTAAPVKRAASTMGLTTAARRMRFDFILV